VHPRWVNKLPQGHAALYDIDTGDFRIWRYWDLPEQPSGGPTSEEELTEELEGLLEKAVRRQWWPDVPVGDSVERRDGFPAW